MTAQPEGFGVYASRSEADDATTLVVLNRTDAARDVSVAVEGAPVEVAEFEHHFPPLSLSALQIPDSGTPSVWQYTATDWAADRPPQLLE